MLEALAWLQRLRQGWRTDWVFAAFLVFAGAAFLQHGCVQRARHARQARIDDAFARLVVATGAADPGGAASALEDLRAEGPSEVQAQLGQALLEAMSSANRVRVPRVTETDVATLRGAALALEGDLAAARGIDALARERYVRAAAILGDEALGGRMERLAARARAAGERATETLRQLATEMEGLFAAATDHGASSTYYRRRQTVSTLGHGLDEDRRRTLSDVLAAVDRAHRASAEGPRGEPSFDSPPPMPPPLEPRDAQDPWRKRAHDELEANYQRRLADFTRRGAEVAQRQLGAGSARADAERYLREARALYERTFAAPAP